MTLMGKDVARMLEVTALLDMTEASKKLGDMQATYRPQMPDEVYKDGLEQGKRVYSNRARSGVWIEPEHVEMAAKLGDQRIKDLYKLAGNAATDKQAEYYLSLIFNPGIETARHTAEKMYQKEVSNGVFTTGEFEELSKSMVTGRPSRPSTSGSSVGVSNRARQLIDIMSADVNPEAFTTTVKYKKISIRDLDRDPEEILSSDDTVHAIYKAIDRKWPGYPNNKMVLTYLLIRSNVDHLVKNLPYYKEVLAMIKQLEDAGKSPWTAGNFQGISGVQQKMYDQVVVFAAQEGARIAGENYDASVVRGLLTGKLMATRNVPTQKPASSQAYSPKHTLVTNKDPAFDNKPKYTGKSSEVRQGMNRDDFKK